MIRLHRSICAILILVSAAPVLAGHRLITQGNGKLAIVDAEGKSEWEMNWGGIHDIHVLKNGNILVQQGGAKVAEIDPKTKQVVWS